jgi:hypothetical protein
MKMKTKILVMMLSAVLLVQAAMAEDGRQVHVYTETHQQSYMWIMTKDTFIGGLFGALIGGAVMLCTKFEADPMIMAYTTGGGMLAGAGFGVWEILDQRAQVQGPVASRGSGVGFAWTFRF